MQTIESTFQGINAFLEQDVQIRDDIRKVVKDLDGAMRRQTTTLSAIYNPKGAKIDEICARAKENFADIRKAFAALQTLVKRDDYFRYNDHWRNSTQQSVTNFALITFLETSRLAMPAEVEVAMGVSKANAPTNFGLELEDYLAGLCALPSELTRLCVNSVVAGDFGVPFKVVKFVDELYAGFRLLNLKNDNLRKRYDSIKYDLKKIEEIVYDIYIRKLAPPGVQLPQPLVAAVASGQHQQQQQQQQQQQLPKQ